MKKIIFILSIIMTFSCKSQNPPVITLNDENLSNFTQGTYLKDTEGLLTPYIGEWIWEEGNSSITIVIEKLTMDYEATTTKQYRDKLVGRIKYVENGILKFSTLTSEIPSLTQRNGTPTDNNLNFSFKDTVIYHRFSGHVNFELLNNGLQAKFRLEHAVGPRFYEAGQQPENPDFSLPKNIDIILTKQ